MTRHTLSLDLSPTEVRRVRWRRSTADLTALEPLDLPLWVACAWDLRPPGGLARQCDQRLDGALSRQVSSGRLGLAFGEVALVGAGQHLAGSHLLLLGLGAPGAFEPSQAGALGRDLADRLHKLGHTRYALEVPWLSEVSVPGASLVATDFVAAHVRRRLTLLGPAGALSVTWVLPETVHLARGRATRPGGRRRASLWPRRHHRARRVTFFRHRLKK